jgi:hypothetical protein
MFRPVPIGPLPLETARVARAAFPKGRRYRRVADALEALFTDDVFPALFPTHGQAAQPPRQLALVTILQLCRRVLRAWGSRTPGSTPRPSVNVAAD